MTLPTVSFEGHQCLRLDGDGSTLMLTTSSGPRVLGLLGHGENVLAVLPGAGLDRPGGGRFTFIGGHRLWAAPEMPDVTYEPDDRPCSVSEVDGGVRVEAPPDGAGLVKMIQVCSAADGWIVDHVIRNASDTEMSIAPWAITQLRPGGVARLPMGAREAGYQADRSLVLWPYTNLDDPRLRLARDEVRIRTEPAGPPLKVGASPSEGCVSYTVDGVTFEKQIRLDPTEAYPDRGAAVQVYVSDAFCELETLGPMRSLGPGEQVEHRERWTLVDRGEAGG